jgi:hypothetical protein
MHFYSRDKEGKIQPKHFVKMAKNPNKKRPSRTTDAKKAFKENGEVWYPSVTSVLNILDKPALLNWKVDKHLEQAFNVPTDFYSFEDWSRKIKAATREEMDKAPKAGTNIHQVLEDYLFTGSYPEDEISANIVLNVEKELNSRNLRVVSKEEYFINDSHGYAGCADLVCVDCRGKLWIIDYKSKQLAEKFKVGKMAFPDHTRQLGAYGEALSSEYTEAGEFEAANIFICLENAEIDFHQHDQIKLYNGFEDFIDCLSIYKRNTYNAKDQT